MLYISAGVGGAALLLSAIMLAVACRKMNKDKVQPERPAKGPNSTGRNNKNPGSNNNSNSNKRGDNNKRDYDDDNSDDYGVEEMSYGRVRLNEVRGARPPTAPRPISAWDV